MQTENKTLQINTTECFCDEDTPSAVKVPAAIFKSKAEILNLHFCMKPETV